MRLKLQLLLFFSMLFSTELIAQVNLTNGLVAYYPFSGNANDASGNGHHGVLVNGPVLTSDRFGNPNSAFFFDGIDDYIKIVDNGAFSTNTISISLWFKTNSDALQNLIGKRFFGNDGTPAGGAQYQFFINYAPFPGIGSNIVGNNNTCGNISNPSSYINTGNIICKSKWYHVVITFDGTIHKIYIDGSLKLSSNTGFTGMINCLSELRFGVWWSGGTIPFSGIMDDIRWYNRALNQAEVTALYDNFPTSSSADFSYSQDPCSAKTIQFSNITANATSFNWDFGNSTTNNGSTNPLVTYVNYGNYLVKLKVTTSSGCIDSVTKIVPINLVQDSLITVADTTICKGNSISLNTLPSINFCWNTTPGLNNASLPNPIATPLNNSIYYFTSQITGSNLVVNSDFSAGNTGFQSDYSSTFPNTGTAQYWIGTDPNSWLNTFASCGDKTTGTGNMMMVRGTNTVGVKIWQQIINVSPNTNYSFSFWLKSLSIANPAKLKFSINGNTLTSNIQASVIACQWNNFFATWNSGNNTTATITIVNNNTIAAGNDFALDDISFAPVFIKQDSIKITVTDPPALTITPNSSICPGDSLPLSVSGASVYSWSPNSGLSNAGIQNPLASPAATTKYIVSAYNLPGCTAKDSVIITVKPKPVITKSNDTSFCTTANPVTIFATSPGATQFSWSPTTGLSNPSIYNPVANPAATSNYHVTVTGSNGCKSIDSVKVSVLPVPTVDTRPDTTICNGTQTILFTSSSGATTFSWFPVTGLSNPGIANPVASPTTVTKYFITASNGTCTAKDSVTIGILPAPTITKSNDTTICDQGLAQLFASGANSYSWFPSTSLNSSITPNPIASPNATTVYHVVATGINGCSKTDSIKVNWIAKPVFSISPPASAVCLGSSITLTASGADTYNWFAGNNIQSPASASTLVLPGITQQYIVAVHHNFCKISDTLKSAITVNPLPTTIVSKSNDIDCSNASAILNATGGINYSWTPLQGITGASSATPVVTPATTTMYVVNVMNAEGCSKKDSIKVLVAFNPLSGGYNMPDAFTPNGDGKNDCFGIKYWGGIISFDFSIYNRWGEVVFHSNNPSACWDGTYKGIPQASATFVYQIKAKTACGEVYKKGTVILIK